MRAFGINYDTGFTYEGRCTRSAFVDETVRRELQIIAEDLRATAVRVSGDDLGRVSQAGHHALDAGLELWFSPMAYDLQPDGFADFMDRSAVEAEHLRRAGGDVVLVLGGEISLFCSGFVPGEGMAGRTATMGDPATWTSPERMATMMAGASRARSVLSSTASAARARFGGPITYAAGVWEDVDWSHFDFASFDAYRDASNAARYREQIRGYRAVGKPVAITEFGCCTYRGAADRGGTGWMIIDDASGEPVLDGDYQRDEEAQARYFRELFSLFDAEGVDAAFWFSFAGFELPRRPDEPRRDLDLASYGLVATLAGGHGETYPTMPWEPKQTFFAVAEAFAASLGRRSDSSRPESGRRVGRVDQVRPRLATVGDAEVVARLLHDFNTEFSTPSPGVVVLAARLRALLARDETIAIVAGEPAVAVALVTFRPNVWYAGPVALLDELYVVPDLRGRGIGSAVVEELVSVSRGRGVELIEINVDEGDVEARRFYERHGFSATEPGSTERSLYYTRELA